MIYQLISTTGRAFITNSENGAIMTFFENILKVLLADTEKYLLVQVDSTFCKVHQHAAGARKKHGNQAIGVSHGGKITKIHALVTENFQLIVLLLTGGNIHDSECATELLSKVNLD